MKLAPMKRSIYSLDSLREVMAAANRRYLEFLSCLDDPSSGVTSPRPHLPPSSTGNSLLPRLQPLHPS